MLAVDLMHLHKTFSSLNTDRALLHVSYPIIDLYSKLIVYLSAVITACSMHMYSKTIEKLPANTPISNVHSRVHSWLVINWRSMNKI